MDLSSDLIFYSVEDFDPEEIKRNVMDQMGSRP